MTAEPVQDVLCLSLPEEIDPTQYLGHPDASIQTAFLAKLTQMAHQSVWAQWRNPRPIRVDFKRIEWLVTQTVEDIESFQPAHDCADCWMGNLKAEAFLRDNPGRWIAMANLEYTPFWEETSETSEFRGAARRGAGDRDTQPPRPG